MTVSFPGRRGRVGPLPRPLGIDDAVDRVLNAGRDVGHALVDM